MTTLTKLGVVIAQLFHIKKRYFAYRFYFSGSLKLVLFIDLQKRVQSQNRHARLFLGKFLSQIRW